MNEELDEVWDAINDLRDSIHEMTEEQVSEQAQIDQLTTDLTSGIATVQAELNALEAQVNAGQPVNLTALQAAVASVAGLVPTPPPPPPPTPAPAA